MPKYISFVINTIHTQYSHSSECGALQMRMKATPSIKTHISWKTPQLAVEQVCWRHLCGIAVVLSSWMPDYSWPAGAYWIRDSLAVQLGRDGTS